MRRALPFPAVLASSVLALAWPAAAQSVAFSGRMGAKALLVIDGQPQMLAAGDAARGVRLVRIDGDEAIVERGGAQAAIRLGGAPVSVGAGAPRSSAREIVIAAGPGGHFVAGGAINGRAAQFMVDTGATLVTISRADAERLGIDWRSARPVLTQTAGGTSPAALLTLSAVRVGEVEIADVPALVVPAPMPAVLLGNSFLSRFQMRRENDVMRLELR